jgi:2,5-diamino-6-(ribosylamino)-4(3H)-pyrimidinone 5'-phosphate reductase
LKKVENPYVILSAAMTMDGKIASITGDPELSDEDDWKEVHKLRTEVDGIMVGKGTIIKDDPKLHIKYYDHKGYYRIIVDSNLSIPIESKAITYQPEIYPTIICTTENVSKKKIKLYEDRKVKIVRSGKGEHVDLKKLMLLLKEIGIKTLLLEGGGNLNWSFVRDDLINEIRLTIAPWIVGGKDATSLVEGLGFSSMSEAIRFNLLELRHRNNYIILRYKRNQ